MGMVAILFNDADPFEQIDNTPSTGGPKCNLMKKWSSCSRNEDASRLRDFIHVYSPGARADNPG